MTNMIIFSETDRQGKRTPSSLDPNYYEKWISVVSCIMTSVCSFFFLFLFYARFGEHLHTGLSWF